MLPATQWHLNKEQGLLQALHAEAQATEEQRTVLNRLILKKTAEYMMAPSWSPLLPLVPVLPFAIPTATHAQCYRGVCTTGVLFGASCSATSSNVPGADTSVRGACVCRCVANGY